ncbi:restriction endonuclease subunit S [Aliarcobacter cryaerophilus]|uniref:restriction endonuclease subunit S n=1 Tax=Aliarcobacter cryaerophilus TaxID=28198 RepID=UPI003DA33B8A
MKIEEIINIDNTIPVGWEVVLLDDLVLKIFAGGDKPDEVSNEKTEEFSYPIFSNGLKDKGLYGYSNAYRVDEECITISARGTIGYTEVRTPKFTPIVRLIVIVPTEYTLSKYLKFYFENLIVEKSGTSIPQLTVPMIKPIPIKLPPLNEQKRIVAKIEKLFSNLDNSDKYLLHLEKQLKRYRQSVLKSAFEGELTKEWRENKTNLETADELLENIKKERILYIKNEIREKFKDKPEKWIKDKINSGIKKYLESLIILRNDILPKSWSETFLQCLTFEHTQDIVDGPFGSNLKASEYQESGIPIIRLQNIDRNIFIDKNIQFVSEKKAEQLKRHSYKQGDIVITKLGAPLGKACIIPDTIDNGIIVADVVRLRLFEKYFDKKYVSYFINSNYPISQLEVLVKGTTRPRVNLTHIRELRVYICSILEQKEIVNQIEKHFSIIDKLEIVVQQSIKESKRLRQSILKQAFEGKLVEQDPNDESASLLLEKIAKAKEEYLKVQKKQVRKK